MQNASVEEEFGSNLMFTNKFPQFYLVKMSLRLLSNDDTLYSYNELYYNNNNKRNTCLLYTSDAADE